MVRSPALTLLPNLCPPLLGISVSSLSDSLFVLHVQREDNKQKVPRRTWEVEGVLGPSPKQGLTHSLHLAHQGDVVLQSDHVIETLTKTALSADRVNNININQGR